MVKRTRKRDSKSKRKPAHPIIRYGRAPAHEDLSDNRVHVFVDNQNLLNRVAYAAAEQTIPIETHGVNRIPAMVAERVSSQQDDFRTSLGESMTTAVGATGAS